MSPRRTLTPSSWRSRFSRRIFREKGSRLTWWSASRASSRWMVTRRSPTSSSERAPKLLSDMSRMLPATLQIPNFEALLGSVPKKASKLAVSPWRSVLGGDLVGCDVHLGDVGLPLDLAGLVADRRPQLASARGARPVEPLVDGSAA